MKFQRLTSQDVKLLHRWEQAHRVACDAEHLAAHLNVHAGYTLRIFQQRALALRADADASFRLLLEVEAFGELEEMP